MKNVLWSVALTLLAWTVGAQEIEFKTSAPRMVTVGEPFRVEFSLNAKPANGSFSAPDFPNFEVLAGPSTSQGQSISIVNGKVDKSVNYTYTFVVQATRAGAFTLEAAQVEVDDKRYTTSPLAIEVVDSQDAGANSSSASSSGASAPSASQRRATQSATQQRSSITSEDLFVRVQVNRTSVYLGEPVRATFKLYTRVPLSGVERTNFPAFNGFWVQDLDLQHVDWERENYNDRVYDVRPIREVLLYPQQTGKLYVEQFGLDVVAQMITQSQTSNSLFDNFFGGPQVSEVRRSLSAAPVLITVKELPAGAPASFSGAVGNFTLSGGVSATELGANTSATYQIKISGSGNLPLIQTPTLNLPTSFEQYKVKSTESLQPTSAGIKGYRQFDYPFIARAEGEYTIDSVQFTYFDPAKARYITLTERSEQLMVLPDSTASGSSPRLVSGVNKEDLKILDQDIRFIYVKDPHLRPQGSYLITSLGYWLSLLLMLLLSTALYFWFRKHLRELQNITLVRYKKANKIAVQRLKRAAQHMQAGEEQPFYEELLKVLWGYMSDKLNIPVSNLTKDNMREGLTQRGVSTELLQSFMELITECESAQYSPSKQSTMSELYSIASSLLSKFESVIKR